MAEQHPEEKPNIDPTTGMTGKGASSSATGTGPSARQMNEHQGHKGKSTETVNTGDTHAQGNLGGRNPSEPSTATGDQDSTQNRSDITLIDPMTSRDPETLDKIKKSDGKGGLATRDP